MPAPGYAAPIFSPLSTGGGCTLNCHGVIHTTGLAAQGQVYSVYVNSQMPPRFSSPQLNAPLQAPASSPSGGAPASSPDMGPEAAPGGTGGTGASSDAGGGGSGA